MIYLRKKLNEETGSALLLVLVLTTIFGILGTSLLYITSVHHKNVYENELKLRAYYAAETGIRNGVYLLTNNLSFPAPDLKVKPWSDEEQLGYKITKEVVSEGYKITSIGYSTDKEYPSTKLSVILGKEKWINNILFDYTAFNSAVQGTNSGNEHDLNFGVEEVEITSLDDKGKESTSLITLYNNITLFGNIYGNTIILPPLTNSELKFNNAKLIAKKNILTFIPNSKSNNNTADLKLYGDELSSEIVPSNKENNFKQNFSDLKAYVSPKTTSISGDVHITSKEDFLDLLNGTNGWLHVHGDFVVDEGVTIDNLDELVIYADGGILLGAKKTASYTDQVVNIKGEHILLLSDGTLGEEWKAKAPIQNNSYRDSFLSDGKGNSDTTRWDQISILANNKTVVDGWLVGSDYIVFDYKKDEVTTINSEVEIGDGVIGEKVLFPRKIILGSNLYYKGWNVFYNVN